MLCQHCGKNEANTFYQETINGQVRKMQLCSECAEKLTGMKPQFGSIFNMPLWHDNFGLFDGFNKQFFGMPSLGEGRKCPVCGTTENELTQTGRAGCGECYNTFSDILTPYIKKLHGAAAHVGSAPQQDNALTDLKTRLKNAVDSENYEEAARLRDEIRRQEGENHA